MKPTARSVTLPDMRIIPTLLVCSLLSSCFALQMEFDDPLQAAGETARLQVLVNSPQSQLAETLEAHLVRLLPRERGVLPVFENPNCQLKINLRAEQQPMPTAPVVFGPQGSPQLRMELSADVEVWRGETLLQNFKWVERGHALESQQADLQAALLTRLQNDILQKIQPRYVYR